MPPLFLLDSNQSCRFQWHSGGFYQPKCHFGHQNSTSTVSRTVYIMSIFFPDFMAILASIAILGSAHRPCNQYPYIVINSLHDVSSFSPDFLIIFASITILGNVNGVCKQCFNIINNNLHHVSLFFPVFFSSVFLIIINILENSHRPCKQYHNIITTISILFLFYYYFSCENTKTFHIWQISAPFQSLDSGAILV